MTKAEQDILLKFAKLAIGKSTMETIEALRPDCEDGMDRRHWVLDVVTMRQAAEVIEVLDAIKKREG